MYPGNGGPAVTTIESFGQIVSEGAFVEIEAEDNSPKKSTKIVIPSLLTAHVSLVISAVISSPLSISPAPSPAVAVMVRLSEGAPKDTPLLKNSYAVGPPLAGACIVIMSPAQNKLFSTPVVKVVSISDFGLIVTIFESVLAQEMGSSKIPFPLMS